MKQYNTYKPSGIEWLGDIPEHWEVKRVKDVTKYVKTGTTPAASKGDFFTDGTEIWFTPSDINNGNIENSNRKVTISAFEERELTFFPENSVYLIGIGGTQGKVAICSIKASCNQQINVLVGSKVVFPRFLFYQIVVTGSTLLKWSNYTTMPIFTQSDTKYLGFILPQYSEQTAIANYLDTKTAAIDRKIELLTTKADKYKALRRSLINETVCRGLNPNAPLKDSGIEWIGKIPEHWEVKRLKDIFDFAKGKNASKYSQEYVNDALNFGIYPVYSGQTEDNGIMAKINSYDYNLKEYILLVTTVGAKAMETKLITGKFSLSQNCAIISLLNNKNDIRFLYYYITQLFVEERKVIPTIMQPSLRIDDLNKYFLLLPDISEQKCISVYLDNKTAQIDSILTNIGEQISTLTQLRKTLINDVVTGKLKVTD